MPINVHVDPSFLTYVNDLIGRSDTLTRQCHVLASARHVAVTVVTVLRAGDSRARATFLRAASGGIRVRIEIPVGADFPELLAHELEHVLEQIEGVNLAEQSRVRGTGVYRVSATAYETSRAKAAGRAAALELANGAGRQAQVAVQARDAVLAAE